METLKRLSVEDMRKAIWVYERLQKISRKLHRIYENQCNGYEYKGMEKKEQNLRAQAHSIANDVGLQVYHQTDPRGCAIYLIDDTMNNSNYNNGLAVY